MPFHTLPIASFWTEWWAGALGLAAAAVGLLAPGGRLSPRSLPLSPLLLIPGVLLAALLLQFALGRLEFPQLGLLYAVYLLWAGLLLVLGRHLADTVGLTRLADVLALALALGALISAAIALVQWLGIADRVPWVIRAPGPMGNIAQANHYAHYSWLGMASAFYLRGRGYLSRIFLWFLLLAIGFGSLLSGSRSVLLYPLLLLAALAWARRRNTQGPPAALLADAALLLPALVALNFFGAWASPRIPGFWAALGAVIPSPDLGGNSILENYAVMPGERLLELASGPSARIAAMRAAWSAFVEHPWLGQGAGNYPWASFMAAAGSSGDAQFLVTEHAHNFVLQLMAEFGAPAAAAVLLLFIFWARQFLLQHWRLEHFWCASILGIGAVHSLLEYPLWYSHFLGPTALLLGATAGGRTIRLAGRRLTIYLAVAALAGAWILGNLRSDFAEIRTAVYRPFAAQTDRQRALRDTMERLIRLQSESLLSPWALRLIAYLNEPNRDLAQDRADLCLRGIRLSPERSRVTVCAMQLAVAGRDADARQLALAVLHAYPDERSATAGLLALGAKAFPEVEPLRALIQPQ